MSGTAGATARALAPSDWARLSAGPGTRGPRPYDWAYPELAAPPADAVDPALDESLRTRGLLIRCSLAGGSPAYFHDLVSGRGTPVGTLVAVEGRRWAIGDALETAKAEGARLGAHRDPLVAEIRRVAARLAQRRSEPAFV